MVQIAKIVKNLRPAGRRGEMILFFLSLIIIIGSIIYFFYALDWLGIIATLILTILIFLILKSRILYPRDKNNHQILDKKSIWLLAGYGLFWLAALGTLWQNRSLRPLISPWDVVSPNFFWFYALASGLLLAVCLKKDLRPVWKIVCLSAHYFLSAGVALIIYRLGYGFDPFVHRATMELISTSGSVLPKPPYYLGEYSLIVIFHKLSGLSIELLNRILVPGLAAIFLPRALWYFLQSISPAEEKTSRSLWLTILFLPILGFSPFILTTPQNLSYLFLILTILYTLPKAQVLLPLILALATTAIHPLTGLPALGWVALILLNRYQAKLKIKTQKIFNYLILAFLAFALPLALFIAGGANWQNLSSSRVSFLGLFATLFNSVGLSGRENWLLNLVYLVAHNYNLLIIGLIIAAIIYFFKTAPASPADYRWFGNNLIRAGGALIVALLLSYRLSFNDLINYEQSGYANRILIIIAIFSLPLIINLLRRIIELIRRQNILTKSAWIIAGLTLLLISVYLSYPRFDKYWNSRGYSTSGSDRQAVELVNQMAADAYIVLANQQVSAAALSTFGFNHYYQTPSGLLYFYPIPTGGPLYQYYLEMVYKNPDRQTMLQALDLAGVNEGYLIINKYWYQSGRIINTAKLSANHWRNISDEVYIFQYQR